MDDAYAISISSLMNRHAAEGMLRAPHHGRGGDRRGAEPGGAGRGGETRIPHAAGGVPVVNTQFARFVGPAFMAAVSAAAGWEEAYRDAA